MAKPQRASYDTVIVGGGPAGLSAALVLGRSLRRVLLCDNNKPRNAASHGLHNFLTRDGILPSEFRRIAYRQLRRYETVKAQSVEVENIQRVKKGFQLILDGGERVIARKVLIATGVVDQLPDVDGVAELYGRSIFHCPYCDGWEVRKQPLAVYGKGLRGYGLALELKGWTDDVILCTDGPGRLTRQHRERLNANKIAVYEGFIARFESSRGKLRRIIFKDGSSIERSALFFNTGQQQRCELARSLGCLFTSKGTVKTGKHEATSVPGLYVAGDASHNVQWVIVAASEGAQAAFAINTALLAEDIP